MSMWSDYRKKWTIACNKANSPGQRVFSCLEGILFPLSLVTIGGMVVLVVCRFFGCHLPASSSGAGWALTILSSGAIGYLTNWIAIEMLFKPYEQKRWLVGWKQGLVPRNKGKIAEQLGEKATELIKPDKVASEMCEMAGKLLQDQSMIESVQRGLQKFVTEHEREIADFLAPRLEEKFSSELKRVVTVDNISEFWRAQIEPRLQSAETRAEVARLLVEALDRRAPVLTAILRPKIINIIREWADGKWYIPTGIATSLANRIIDKDMVENGLRTWLNDPQTVPMLRDELLSFVTTIRDYIQSPENKQRVSEFAMDIRQRIQNAVHGYLENNLSRISGSLLSNELLWQKVASLLQTYRPEIEQFIRDRGVPVIQEKLDIKGRVASAVNGMKIEEFHQLVNDVAAEHLGAIQVLGYILGSFAGVLLKLAN